MRNTLAIIPTCILQLSSVTLLHVPVIASAVLFVSDRAELNLIGVCFLCMAAVRW
ncbi:MAG: hypothetical protein UFG06_13530 [Lachnospiraceae bacterium]|nr:hypothetical protein [Lachnospiraceae bacterium]